MSATAMPSKPGRLQMGLALVGIGFGVATLFSGGSVLAGRDPGYVVFRPLLVYNTLMGLAYVAAGAVAWRSAGRGARAAGAIFVANLVVLGIIAWLYATGSAVAVDSLRAMTLRTGVWLALFAGLGWVGRTAPPVRRA